MRKKSLLAAGAIVASIGLTGCIAQTGFHWKDATPKKGDTTKGIVDLRGTSEGPTAARGVPNKSYFFIGLAAKSDGVDLKGFKFDPKKVLGNSVKMIEDANVAEFAASECSPIGGNLAYVTEKKVETSPKNKVFQAQFKAELANAGGAMFALVSSGQWFDDGDDVAEDPSSSDDEYSCSGFASTFLGSKNFEDLASLRAQPFDE